MIWRDNPTPLIWSFFYCSIYIFLKTPCLWEPCESPTRPEGIRAEVANIAAAKKVSVITNARYRLTHRVENMGHGFDFQNNYCDKQNFIKYKKNIYDFQNGGVLRFEKMKLYVATSCINKTYLGT